MVDRIVARLGTTSITFSKFEHFGSMEIICHMFSYSLTQRIEKLSCYFNRVLFLRADVHQRQQEKARLEKAYKECDHKLNSLVHGELLLSYSFTI